MLQETPPLQLHNVLLSFGVLGAYMLAIPGIGFYVCGSNRKTVDGFNSGGHVPWKLSAASLVTGIFIARSARAAPAIATAISSQPSPA